jgi:hypothetical protein
MAMRNHLIRFPDATWEAVCEEAQHLGISAAEFAREAVVARVAVARERRLDPAASMDAVFRAARVHLEQADLQVDR